MIYANGKEKGSRNQHTQMTSSSSEEAKKKMPVYEKMDPITHIHKRPDMYVGSLERKTQPGEWLFGEDDRFHWESAPVYSDGLWRIFLEPISNIIDNVWRSRQAGIECKKIRVDIDETRGQITLWNDGLWIPIEKQGETMLYNAQLIFGTLLTSSNYDDTEDRLSSGRNGLGVKLTNVFSTEFEVECGDPDHGQVYKQMWHNHMREVAEPVLRRKKATTGYTCLRFIPDLPMFGMDRLDATALGLFRKTCVDMAMATRVPVHLNGKRLVIHNFKDYVMLYPMPPPASEEEAASKRPLSVQWDNDEIQARSGETMEAVICPSFDDEAHEIGFVNGIYNREGGVHTEIVASEFFKGLVARLNKGRTTHLFTAKDVRPHFSIFVNTQLVNPTFSNQSKTRLLSPIPRVAIDPKHLTAVMNRWGFADKMKELLRVREMSSLKKSEKKVRGYHRIEGLDHANRAGGKDSNDCTLILCEGLSAKTYAITGIECGWNGHKGRDYFGVFALKGKLLNVRNASTDSISGNKEIASIIQALNLRHRVDYREEAAFQTLAYGRVMIITDADVDGLHIASLILNLFHVLFPTLLRREQPFLFWMMTPVAKIFPLPSSASSPVLTFYNDFEYQKALQERTGTRFKVKYYKGLGTSSDEEVRDTFGAKVVSFQLDEKADDQMAMVFSKTAANERKRWMEGYDPLVYRTPIDTYDITMFIDQEHIRFSIDDCKRNIPNLYDGLKLSQRKILFSVFKKGLVPGGKSMKVAQLAGYVAETSNYHHGEQCLYDTITRMAQDFVGSNNIPLLFKDGQFGSRTHNGRDAANGRYIFTKMTPLTRRLFPAEDDALLTYTLDDGEQVEPDYYVPILPMILVNGCRTGIGSGWSCNVPLYHPMRLMECVQEWLDSLEKGGSYMLPELVPHYEGFRGRIERVGEMKFRSYGIVELETMPASVPVEDKKPRGGGRKKKTSGSGESHRITEIPVDASIDKYKDLLERLLEEKKLKGLKNYSSPNQPLFCLTPADGFALNEETLHLTSDIHLSNMVLFTELGRLQKYADLNEIFHHYCMRRLSLYRERKAAMLATLRERLAEELLRRRFLEDVIEDRVQVFRRSEEEIMGQLSQRQYPSGSDFLLAMPVRQFTREHLLQLGQKIGRIEKEIAELERTTPSDMWRGELDALAREYQKLTA